MSKSKEGIKINFKNHIDIITKETVNTIIALLNNGLIRYINDLHMRSIIFKSIICSKMCYGSRCCILNEIMNNKIECTII